MKRLALTIAVPTALCSLLLMAAPADATHFGHKSRIAFRRFTDNGASIFTIRPDGTGRRRVTHPRDGVVDSDPAWAPDGRWIAYSVYRNGSQDDSSIVKIHPNGKGRTSLSGACSAPCITEFAPAWSPNGTQIAYTEGLGSAGQVNVRAIFVMDADGMNPTQITQQGAATDQSSPISDYFPAWSPNGRKLAFSRTNENRGKSAIFTVKMDGTSVHRVTAWRRDAAGADWSPDGRWIVFRTQESSDIHGRLAIIHPDGNGLRVITPPGGKWGRPSFSPSGGRVASSHFPRGGDPENTDIYIVNVSTSHVRDVTPSDVAEASAGWGPRRAQ